ncbi:hypothetical protein TNCV_4595941 [Trichonephila clavipes]|uniref:Uncharacterized protein n=1 Tax=Trichonephila clavipes TaxID=2585209 RepID=A0A8X7BJB2_TRICX|nr:hypothetical protein TNCV_4595941 [Trichonephila clavipes]
MLHNHTTWKSTDLGRGRTRKLGRTRPAPNELRRPADPEGHLEMVISSCCGAVWDTSDGSRIIRMKLKLRYVRGIFIHHTFLSFGNFAKIS